MQVSRQKNQAHGGFSVRMLFVNGNRIENKIRMKVNQNQNHSKNEIRFL